MARSLLVAVAQVRLSGDPAILFPNSYRAVSVEDACYERSNMRFGQSEKSSQVPGGRVNPSDAQCIGQSAKKRVGTIEIHSYLGRDDGAYPDSAAVSLFPAAQRLVWEDTLIDCLDMAQQGRFGVGEEDLALALAPAVQRPV